MTSQTKPRTTPVAPAVSGRLSPAQVSNFHRAGYVVVPGLLVEARGSDDRPLPCAVLDPAVVEPALGEMRGVYQ